MVVLFILAMMGVSYLLLRSARRGMRTRTPYERRPGRPDGVRSVYKRGH